MSNTAAAQFFQQRRAEFDAAASNRALAAMRRGQTLHLQFLAGRPSWSLSGGQSITASVAAILIKHALVEPADGACFLTWPGKRGDTEND